mmetsp:Transcript_114910/g.305538  ORF Transcript_114910/g.305538 Transcript_114910/m.305538 type:complete len:166 (-) Transcript_114910:92-589(-)
MMIVLSWPPCCSCLFRLASRLAPALLLLNAALLFLILFLFFLASTLLATIVASLFRKAAHLVHLTHTELLHITLRGELLSHDPGHADSSLPATVKTAESSSSAPVRLVIIELRASKDADSTAAQLGEFGGSQVAAAMPKMTAATAKKGGDMAIGLDVPSVTESSY